MGVDDASGYGSDASISIEGFSRAAAATIGEPASAAVRCQLPLPLDAASLTLGTRVLVFWAGNDSWYAGKIISIDKRGHRILYDDNDKKFHDLTDPEEVWELEGALPSIHAAAATIDAPVAADTSRETLPVERPEDEEEAEARADQDRRVAEMESRLEERRLEVQRLEQQLRRERQLKEQALLPEEKRVEITEVIWDAIVDKREKAGWTNARIERDPWKFKVQREPVVCAFTKVDAPTTLVDVGKNLSIVGGVVRVGLSSLGVERAVLWDGRAPEVSKAEILSVEERVGGQLKVRDNSDGQTLRLDNPATGLVPEVLAHMGKVKSQAKLWQKTQVSFGVEDGVDEGGLTEEMHAAFWKGVTSAELKLFECADQLHSRGDQPVFLPKPGACTHSLKMVGLMLCRSVIKDKPTGPGLSRFVLDFLLEAEDKPSRAFAATSKPIVEQAERAIESLMQFDVLDAATYSRYLSDESGELRDSDWIAIWLAGTLGENVKLNEDHELFSEPPTVDNLPHAIVESCRWILCESRRVELEALRHGFTCYVSSRRLNHFAAITIRSWLSLWSICPCTRA